MLSSVVQTSSTTSRSRRRDAVFRALADPTRRAMLDRLRLGERSVSELALPFDISQPAVSQHLMVLSSAGLVRSRRSGRQRVYRLHAAPLRDMFVWLERYEQFWRRKLDALGVYLDEEKEP
jgi:DNA-binding transcriptional ArsR family regulator